MFRSPVVICAAILLTNSLTVAAQDGQTKAAACGACHGINGNSATPLWPNLAGQHAKYTFEQLKAFKDGTRQDPNMNAMVLSLTEEDMQDIAAYYATEQPAINSITVDQVAAGEAIYRGGNAATGVPSCMACHGPNGAGNALAGYPSLRGQHAEYTVKQLKDYRDRNRSTDLNTMMQMVSERLTVEEMEAVATYISALH